MDEARLFHLIRLAIEKAMINYPNFPPERGTTWPAHNVNPEEAALYAHAAVKAIGESGLEVVEKDKK